MKRVCFFICFLFTVNYCDAQLKQAAIKYIKKQPTRDSLNKIFVEPATYRIIYDFQSGEILSPLKKIRVHTPVVFVVKNINPFAYNIKITPKDSVLAPSSFDFEVNEWISKAVLENTQSQLEKEQIEQEQNTKTVEPVLISDVRIEDSLASISKSLKASEEIQTLNKEQGKLQDSLLKIEEGIKNLNARMEQNQSIQNDLEKNSVNNAAKNDTVPRIQKQITDLKSKADSVRKRIEDIPKEIEAKKGDVIDELQHFLQLRNNLVAAYDRYMRDCQIIFSVIRNTKILSTMAEDPNLSIETFDQNDEKRIDSIIQAVKVDQYAVNRYRRSYSEFSNTYASLKYEPTLANFFKTSGIDKLFAHPDHLKEKADATYNRISQLPIDIYLKQSQWIATILETEDPFIYRSIPLQPVNDLIEFKVDITKRNKLMPNAYYKEMSFVYHQPVYGGTRVDFSLGLALSYFPNTPTYETGYNNIPDSSQLSIYQTSNDMIAPSLLGLITMSHRKTRYVAYGVSAGLGIDVVNGKVQLSNFFFGPSMIFGKFDRLLLSGGGSVRNVQRLKSGYSIGSPAGQITDISSVLADKYKIGMFLSVTYSLTSNAKKMMKEFR